ncbi:MAG: TIGR01620 family protein [Pseudomonadota bacterium]
MNDRKKPSGPVLIEIEESAAKPRKAPKSKTVKAEPNPAVLTPATAPPVPDTPGAVQDLPSGQAMQTVATLTARKPSFLGRWFWGSLLALVSFVASVAAWNFVTALLAANPLLGLIASLLLGVFVLVLLAIAIKELAAFSRLKRIDRVQKEAQTARATEDLKAAQAVTKALTRLYAGRSETDWSRDRMAQHSKEMLDASALLNAAEREVMTPLDQLALREIEAAARQVATITALVPLAFADVIAALTANIRMIRRIAEVYGGRSGTLGSWRLTRTVMLHLVATGAVAITDDLIGSVAGGGILSKVSRRFGEGLVNGALTARVGIAAMDVCRPLPFAALEKPSVTSTVQRALTGLLDRSN